MEAEKPKIKVKFFASLREVFGAKEREIELAVCDVQDVLDIVCDTEQRHQKIFDNAGKIRKEISILKNGRQIDFLDGLKTILQGGDAISIFPPIVGG